VRASVRACVCVSACVRLFVCVCEFMVNKVHNIITFY